MKNNPTIILLFVFSILLSGCMRENIVTQSDLTEGIWTSTVVNDYCVDTLKFHKDNKVTYYSCEIGWDYNGFYETDGDTIEIEINMTQFEANTYDTHKPTSRYLLKFKDDELEWLRIEHFRGNQFEEVKPEIYEQLDSWEKILHDSK